PELHLPVPLALRVAAEARECGVQGHLDSDVFQTGLPKHGRQLAACPVVEAELLFCCREPSLQVGLDLRVGRMVGEAEAVEVAADDAPAGPDDPYEFADGLFAIRHPLKQVL